jgi:hypothetical protein
MRILPNQNFNRKVEKVEEASARPSLQTTPPQKQGSSPAMLSFLTFSTLG